MTPHDAVRAQETFRTAVESSLLKGVAGAQVARGARELSHRYRSGLQGPQVRTSGEVSAYALGRLFGTHAAVLGALNDVAAADPAFRPASMLDLGAGPGTASWAASAVFGSLASFTLVEGQPEMIAAGRALARDHDRLASAEWRQADVSGPVGASADLVVAAYVLGELASPDAAVRHWWNATRGVLVVIEPGTPEGFERIRTSRAALIEDGAHVVGPCTHALACPMAGGDWCHFNRRIQRTRLQREAKQGTRTYEDEKFSYVALAREPVALHGARVLRSRHGGGKVQLKLCEPSGELRDVIVPRSDRDNYARARRTDWGDVY